MRAAVKDEYDATAVAAKVPQLTVKFAVPTRCYGNGSDSRIAAA